MRVANADHPIPHMAAHLLEDGPVGIRAGHIDHLERIRVLVESSSSFTPVRMYFQRSSHHAVARAARAADATHSLATCRATGVRAAGPRQ